MDHVAVRGPGLVDLWTTLRARFGPVIQLPERPAALDALHDFVRVALPRLAGDHWAVARETVDLVGQLVREIERADAAAQAPVERAVEELLRFPFRDTGLKEIALRHGCTREHLCRVFALRTGEPPGRHLARLRLERALQLLAQTDLPLAAVAQRCGAGSAHTLARWVRSATGRGPRVLRQAARRGAG